jgi:hypothetical protein
MSVSETSEVFEVLDRVRGWPVENRVALAREILGTVQDEVRERTRPKQSLKSLLGLLGQGDAPPSDEECQKILEEELIKKHWR